MFCPKNWHSIRRQLQIVIAASDWETRKGDNLSTRKYNTTAGWVKVPAQVHTPNKTVEATITQSGMYALFENATIDATGTSSSAHPQAPRTPWAAFFGLGDTNILAIFFWLKRTSPAGAPEL